MTIEKRVQRLERRLTTSEPMVEFEIVEAPPGLSREEHKKWLAQAGPECFTLDLGAAGIKGLEP